jgi:hypothetical protein
MNVARIDNADLERNSAEEELINATRADIKTWAVAAVERFSLPYKDKDTNLPLWQFDDFWKRSNTFHAYLCFVKAAERRWGTTDSEVEKMQALREKMIAANSTFFDSQIGDEGVWADDYGWCGISCLEAHDYLLRIGDHNRAEDYLNRAIHCWNVMCSVGYDSSKTAKPVPHGCSNISEKLKKDGVRGTRNSVTNSNLLVLSLRLYNALKRTDKPAATQYLNRAYAQYVWFNTWFKDKYVSLDDGYYLRQIQHPNGLLDGLLHERPMAKPEPPAEPDYDIDVRPPWETGWVWSGDQGLILAALAEIYLVRDDLRPWIPDPPTFANEVQQAFSSIARGVRYLLFSPQDNVLREAPFHSSFGPVPSSPNPNHGPDYVGGRGVLLRYASEEAVWQMQRDWISRVGFAATASAVWNSCEPKNPPHQSGSLWNKEGDPDFNKWFVTQWGSGDDTITHWDLPPSQIVDGVLQAAGLDSFTAAIRSL